MPIYATLLHVKKKIFLQYIHLSAEFTWQIHKKNYKTSYEINMINKIRLIKATKLHLNQLE